MIKRAPSYDDVTLEVMLGFKDPKFEDRRSAADAAKKLALKKFRAASQDPKREKQRANRLAINDARLFRMAESQAAKKEIEARLAAEAAREIELANKAAGDAEETKTRAAAEDFERASALKAEQKADRDARYAARKAAKKERRRG